MWLTSFVHDGTGLLSGRTLLMAVNNLPVRTLALGGDSVRFERCGVEGEMRLRFAGAHLEMDIRLGLAAEKTEVRLTAPILHFGVSEETVYFNPHTGGSLQNQAAQFKAIYAPRHPFARHSLTTRDTRASVSGSITLSKGESSWKTDPGPRAAPCAVSSNGCSSCQESR